MPILAGWGGKRKRIGNFGIRKCPNCNNWQPQGIYELSRQATLYFIPVAKWGKEYYVICPICEAGLPVVEEKLDELLRACILMPDDETARQIWNAFDTFTGDFFGKSAGTIGAAQMEEWAAGMQEIVENLTYNKEHINQVHRAFVEHVGELLGVQSSNS